MAIQSRYYKIKTINAKGVGYANPFLYIYGIMKQVKEMQLTQREWFDATRVAPPFRNKKKFFRKEKHKKTCFPEIQFVYWIIMELKINNHDYKFSKPWFDAIKPGWDQIFEWYSKEFSIDTVLEIGCFEGKATTYMCEKWLKDREPKKGNDGHILTESDIIHYQNIIFSIN